MMGLRGVVNIALTRRRGKNTLDWKWIDLKTKVLGLFNPAADARHPLVPFFVLSEFTQ
jgi:hypothetical protein